MYSDKEVLIRASILIFGLFFFFSIIHILSSLIRKRPIPWDRLISQIVLFAIIFGVLALPDIVLNIFISLLIFFGVDEIYGVVKEKNIELYLKPLKIFSQISAAIIPLLLYFLPSLFPFYLVLVTITLVSIPIFIAEPALSLAKTVPPALSIVFASLLSFILWLRDLPYGLAFIIFLVFLTNATDSTAYVFGSMLGKRKLAPKLSPSKTIEGTLLSTLFAIGLAVVGKYIFLPFLPIWETLLFAAIVALGAHLGDLVFSVYKRDAGIKDYGHLIPGHGGVLDRFDSLVITTPIFYCLLSLVDNM